MSEEYKRRVVFGMDYGTSDFKYGPIMLGDRPEMVENRGYFPEPSAVSRVMGLERDIVVGKDVPLYLESGAELSARLVYPMRNGVVQRDDTRSWRVVEALSRMALEQFRGQEGDFRGYYAVAALSAVAPRYMYDALFSMYERIAEELGLVAAATILPQPLAVAISHKATSCVVVESGDGNSQVAPISRGPIRQAVVALNRGGGDATALMAEILKDAGYGDLAREQALVRAVKEQLGLLPLNLDAAIRYARENPAQVRATYRVSGTRITIELGSESWARFLPGEYVFNPNHEVFQSYFRRGMAKPRDARIGDVVFYGMLDMAETIMTAVERCPVELQPRLYSQVILSGGNFSWRVPENLRGIAVDSATKLKSMLEAKDVKGVSVVMASEPQYSVWRGCIVYGFALPAGYEWSWERMEGWLRLRK